MINKSIKNQVRNLERSSIIKKSFENRGVTIYLRNLDDIVTITNYIAPEHLCIATKKPEKIFNKILMNFIPSRVEAIDRLEKFVEKDSGN